MKVRVPVSGSVGKSVQFDPNATVGAQIGRDLRLPDGSVPTLAQLATALGVGSSSSGGAQFAYTIWRLIQEIPLNVRAVAALSAAGLVTRLSDGSWVARSLATAGADRITVTDPAGEDGNPTVDLAEIEFGDTGALLSIELDTYGRVVSFRDALLDDLDDVVLDTPVEHDALMYDGAQWQNTPTGPRYLTQFANEYFWVSDEFVRGHNIIGVRYSGPSFVYLPHDLPQEHVITIKDEAGVGPTTVRIYEA